MSMQATLRIEGLGRLEGVPSELFDDAFAALVEQLAAEEDEDEDEEEEEEGVSYGDTFPYCFEALEALARDAGVTPLSAYSTNEWYLEKQIEAALGEDPEEEAEEELVNRIGDWFPAADGVASIDAMLCVLASDELAAEKYRCEKSYLDLGELTWDLRAMRCLLAGAARQGRRFRIVIV